MSRIEDGDRSELNASEVLEEAKGILFPNTKRLNQQISRETRDSVNEYSVGIGDIGAVVAQSIVFIAREPVVCIKDLYDAGHRRIASLVGLAAVTAPVLAFNYSISRGDSIELALFQSAGIWGIESVYLIPPIHNFFKK